MKLKELIPPDHIDLDIDVKTREEVIESLVNLLYRSKAIYNPDQVRKEVIKREHEVGTGIGYGVAIPHAEPGPYPNPIAAFARLNKPVDFKAPDGEKANLIFLLLTPEDTPALHVRLLARICRLTRSQSLRDQLLSAATPETAAQKIAELESDYPELTP